MYTTLQAILAINPEAKATVHTPHDGSAETIEWLEETAEISQKDIDAKKVELETEWNSQAYARARKPLYPDIGDQLDDGSWIVNIQINYLIRFIWFSAALMAFAGIMLIFSKRRA